MQRPFRNGLSLSQGRWVHPERCVTRGVRFDRGSRRLVVVVSEVGGNTGARLYLHFEAVGDERLHCFGSEGPSLTDSGFSH